MLHHAQTKKCITKSPPHGKKLTKQKPTSRPHRKAQRAFATASALPTTAPHGPHHIVTTKASSVNAEEDNNKPLLQIITYPSNRQAITKSGGTAVLTPQDHAPTHLITKLFVQDHNFQQPPITIAQPIGGTTLNDLAASIQKSLPIKPCFVSFSTRDTEFGEHYYLPDPVTTPYHHHYVEQGVDVKTLKQVVLDSQQSGSQGSGIPPVAMDLSKIKNPTLPIPFINAISPQDRQKAESQAAERRKKPQSFSANLEAFTTNFKAMFYDLTPLQNRATKQFQQFGPSGDLPLPKHFTPGSTHIPLHPFTPLGEVVSAASVVCHISYTDEQIAAHPALQQFINDHASQGIVHTAPYPTLKTSQPITTISYDITQTHGAFGALKKDFSNSLLLANNFTDRPPVSTRFLAGLFASVVVMEAYLRITGQDFAEASQHLFGTEAAGGKQLGEVLSFDKGRFVDLSRLKIERDTLTGVEALTNLRTSDVGLFDRAKGLVTGDVPTDQVFAANPLSNTSSDPAPPSGADKQ